RPPRKRPKAAPTQNPIAISRRMSGPCSPARRGFPRLFTTGGIANTKIKREANTVRFLRALALAVMANQHSTDERCSNGQAAFYQLKAGVCVAQLLPPRSRGSLGGVAIAKAGTSSGKFSGRGDGREPTVTITTQSFWRYVSLGFRCCSVHGKLASLPFGFGQPFENCLR